MKLVNIYILIIVSLESVFDKSVSACENEKLNTAITTSIVIKKVIH